LRFELRPRALVEPHVAKDGLAHGEWGGKAGDDVGEVLD
jgi:hypothetical protein